MTFTHPDWLWLLLIVPILLLAKVWADGAGRRVASTFTAPRLRRHLLLGVSSSRSWTIFGLQMVAFALIIVALCGPRWGEEELPQRETGRNLIIAVDSSRSMLADDIKPNRLTRSLLAAQDLMRLLPGDRVGLIAFSGNAYLQAPLTTDHDAVIESIQGIDIYSVPKGGSEISEALKLAVDTFEKSPARNHGLILFSDGGDEDPDLPQWTQKAAEKGVLVLAVGVGTEGGSLIPDPDPNRPGEWLRDSGGNVVKTALKADVLQQLARETRGHYLRLDGRSIDAGLVNQVMAALDRQENEGQPTSKPIERFHWPLSLALLLLLIAWTIRPAAARLPATSRGLAGTAPAALIAIGWFTAAAPVSANWLGLLGGSNDEARRAAAALEAGDPESAAGLYSELLDQEPPAVQEPALQIGLASASYALGKYDEAAAAFSAALARQEPSTQKHSHQGLAHTLYDQGDRTLAKQPQFTLKAWRDAVRHFNAALAIAPEDAAVQENRDFVQKRLDELQQQMEQQKQQQKQKGDKGDKGEKGEKGDKGEEGEQGDQGEEGEEGQQGDKPDGESGENGEQGENGSGGEPEGQAGAGEQPQEPEQLPEGQISAGTPGEPSQNPGDAEAQAQEAQDGERSEETGFSPNEARSFLRTYADDQKAARETQRRQPPANGQDW